MIGFDSNSYTVSEEGQLEISASVLNGSLDDDVELLFSTQGGSAQCKCIDHLFRDLFILGMLCVCIHLSAAGIDFTAISSRRFTFRSSDQNISAIITITNDDIREDTEQFTGILKFASHFPPERITLAPNLTTITITDSDSK